MQGYVAQRILKMLDFDSLVSTQQVPGLWREWYHWRNGLEGSIHNSSITVNNQAQ